jgi:phage terminase large subunit GpA-like protein
MSLDLTIPAFAGAFSLAVEEMDRARTTTRRGLAQFANEEIVLVDGRWKGLHYSTARQPYTDLLYREVDKGGWKRFAIVGPTQSGKTLTAHVIPILYYLFELGETVIVGLPDANMAADKWRIDIFPIIAASRYRRFLPQEGVGSRGSKKPGLIQFGNGSAIRFMTAGGGDKARAGFTARILAVSEVDGFDVAGGTSREGDKLSQLEARQMADPSRARGWFESTASLVQGRIWREYQGGTRSRIMVRCVHCEGWVHPTREQLVGWQGAESVMDARAAATWCCPDCGGTWTEAQRIALNRGAVLVHHGQTVTPAGEVVGDLPRTDTLGFRWDAFNNLFMSGADIAEIEWKRSQEPDEDNATKIVRQFLWALPYDPSLSESPAITSEGVATRVRRGVPEGSVPADHDIITVGMDLGKRAAHWVAISWGVGAVGHIVRYGVMEIASDEMGPEKATLAALRDFREYIAAGFPSLADGKIIVPLQVWIDCGWSESANAVHQFCAESRLAGGSPFCATKGYGGGMDRSLVYTAPKAVSNSVRAIGDHYHVAIVQNRPLIEVDANYWKSWLHARLVCAVEEPGAVTLFDSPNRKAHFNFGKHLASEVAEQQFIPGKGYKTIWNRKHRNNHYLDASYLACAAGWRAGVRLVPPLPRPERPASPARTNDDMPRFVGPLSAPRFHGRD